VSAMLQHVEAICTLPSNMHSMSSTQCLRMHVLYCTVLHCTALHCTVLHCMYCAALYCVRRTNKPGNQSHYWVPMTLQQCHWLHRARTWLLLLLHSGFLV